MYLTLYCIGICRQLDRQGFPSFQFIFNSDNCGVSDLVMARYDGDVIFQQQLQICLQDFIELVRVWEENDGAARLGEAAREADHSVPDETLAVLDVDVQVRGRLATSWPGSGGGPRGCPGTWSGHFLTSTSQWEMITLYWYGISSYLCFGFKLRLRHLWK